MSGSILKVRAAWQPVFFRLTLREYQIRTAMSLQYVTNGKGEKTAVILSISDFEKIREQLEELDDLRLYDRVKARNEPFVTLDDYRDKRFRSHARKANGRLPETQENSGK